MNTIYLRRKNKIFIEKGTGDLPENYLAALLKNIENLGYTLSQDVLNIVRTFSLEELEAFYLQLIEDLKKMVGAHREFKPMYPNFPRQVMEMSEAWLYFNAIIHYVTGLRPVTKIKERLPLFDDIQPKIIGLGTIEEFEAIFINLCASKTSISVQDKEDLAWFCQHYGDGIARLLPAEFPNKENLSVVGALLLKNTAIAPPFLVANFKTATDVLRLAVAMSGGDVSLAKATRFGVFSRPQRRVILELTENCVALTEDMLRFAGRWLRLGEKLHVGEYKERFPRTFAAFDVLRNDAPFESFHGKVERKVEARDTAGALELLQTRPGELARKLDHLLRLNLEQAPVTLEVFESVAPKIATPVLLQVATHFKHRSEKHPLRTFFPKGQVAKAKAIENRLPEIPEQICSRAVAICEAALRERFAALEPLGKCYLDPKLRDFLVPFSQRSAAKSLRTLVRGSKLDLPVGDTLRFFLWWTNGIRRTDIDLSAAFFDENFVYIDLVSYYNLKNFGGHHSGDIVDAPDGAAEFIDVSREKLSRKNVRYVVMSINSYTEQPFCDLPECCAGWMPRQKPNSGEIFEARTVADRVDIASDTRICLPALFDLVENKVTWLDVALTKSPIWNNVENNLSGVSLMARALSNLPKANLYDLFALHITARGEFAASMEEAQTVFSLEQGITPFDLAEIGANWL